MAAIAEYIECEACDFVVLSEDPDIARPKRVESCPDCGGTDFRFPEM